MAFHFLYRERRFRRDLPKESFVRSFCYGLGQPPKVSLGEGFKDKQNINCQMFHDILLKEFAQVWLFI